MINEIGQVLWIDFETCSTAELGGKARQVRPGRIRATGQFRLCPRRLAA